MTTKKEGRNASYRCTYPMWWMYSSALSMPNKIYAMVNSFMPSEKCVQIKSLADPEEQSIVKPVPSYMLTLYRMVFPHRRP